MDGGIIEVGGVKYPVACNAFTPIAFSREFFVERKDGSRRPKDINEDVSVVLEVTSASNMPPIVPLLEIFYACAKTYNATAKEKTDLGKSFEDWVRSFPQSEFDLEREGGWASDVMQIIKDNFFPNAKAHVEAAPAEAPDAAATDGAGE